MRLLRVGLAFSLVLGLTMAMPDKSEKDTDVVSKSSKEDEEIDVALLPKEHRGARDNEGGIDLSHELDVAKLEKEVKKSPQTETKAKQQLKKKVPPPPQPPPRKKGPPRPRPPHQLRNKVPFGRGPFRRPRPFVGKPLGPPPPPPPGKAPFYGRKKPLFPPKKRPALKPKRRPTAFRPPPPPPSKVSKLQSRPQPRPQRPPPPPQRLPPPPPLRPRPTSRPVPPPSPPPPPTLPPPPPPQPVVPIRRESHTRVSYQHSEPEMLVKPAGRSMRFGWVGHGKRSGGSPVGNPFPSDLPKWVPNDIFETGLLYPGKPGGDSDTYKPPPPPPKKEVYKPPPPPPKKEEYTPPQPPKAEPSSYSPPPPPPPPQAPVHHPAPATNSKPFTAFSTSSSSSSPSIPTFNSGTFSTTSFGHSNAPPSTSFGTFAASPQPPSPPQFNVDIRGSGLDVPVQETPVFVPASQQQQPHQASVFNFDPLPNKVYDPATKSFITLPANTLDTSASSSVRQVRQPLEAAPVPPTKPKESSFSEVNYPLDTSAYTTTFGATPVYDVPIKVEETFKGKEKEEPEVFYIFYENSDEDPKNEEKPQTVEVYTSPSQTEDDEVKFVVEEPSNSGFSPPAAEDIRTIYVPIQNAINIPESFDISVGTSFGYNPGSSSSTANSGSGRRKRKRVVKRPKKKNNPAPTGTVYSFPNFPPSTYDNPISSYDAPIYNDGSYTAKIHKVPTPVDDSIPAAAAVPYGTRIKRRLGGGFF